MVKVVPGVGVIEVTIPPEVEVTLAVTTVGVSKDDVSVIIAVGTEAVEAKPSVVAKIARLLAEDAPATAREEAEEAVASAL